ncbi:MAG: hypothetical protein ACTSPB_01215 [Candidatus Thorarchaeota archaeon]
MTEKTLLSVIMAMFDLSSVWFGWLTQHYWTKSLHAQNYYWTSERVFLFTWLQEMAVLSSCMLVVSVCLFLLLLHRVYNIRVSWGDE